MDVDRMPENVLTLGALRASGWESVSVKQEIRRNVMRRVRAGEPVIDGVVGYDDTVLPQLTHALLAGHDVVFLGERGQAKSRMIRGLTGLLDEALPVIDGSEINDDPYAPVSAFAKDLVAERGDDTPIRWIGRDERYGEKLATPDISIADLIGEVDPIKVAEGRYLADEHTIHYGLVPRTNRGIFAINELPDLAERIQVGLLNILEERDVQIRGYKVQLPLDLFLVASANPEDYTNRGRIITPLKDRFGAQIRTHYPLDHTAEIGIVESEARLPSGTDARVQVPAFMAEMIARLSHLARESPHVSERSGVSVRMTIDNYETLVAGAERRALANGEDEVVPRISDLDAIVASTAGKVEIEGVDSGEEGAIFDRLVKKAVLDTYRETVSADDVRALVHCIDDTNATVSTSASMPAGDLVRQLTAMDGSDGFMPVLERIGGESPAGVASALELVLEGLHLSKRLNKVVSGGAAQDSGESAGATYGSR